MTETETAILTIVFIVLSLALSVATFRVGMVNRDLIRYRIALIGGDDAVETPRMRRFMRLGGGLRAFLVTAYGPPAR